MRLGMSYKKGDIVLIDFPFTDLSHSKKRPVLIVKDENNFNDIVCFQITSQSTQQAICKIEQESLYSGELKLVSFVKYDKCFTLSSEMVNKKLASVDDDFMNELKTLFCNSIF
jgi:mRNA interferase MazF